MNIVPRNIGGSISRLIDEFRPIVLVFLPNTNELQRFVLSGAFDDLAKSYQLHFVVTSKDADLMRASAPDLLRAGNMYELDVDDDRYREWCRVFEMSCHLYSHRSKSFELRVGAKPAREPEFEVRLLRAAWRVAKRVHPILRRIPALRARWGRASKSDLKTIDKFIRSDVWIDRLFDRDQLSDELRQKLGAIRPYWPMMDLLQQVNPIFCVIPTSLLDFYCNDLLLAAEELGHTVLPLQSGWDNLSSKGTIHYLPTYIGVWGPQSGVHAKKIQRVAPVVLGAPHYGALVPAPRSERERFRAGLGIAPDELLILFGGSFRQFDETSVLTRLENAIDSGAFGARKLRILYRPHPWRADRDHEDDFFDVSWKHVLFDPDMQERYRRSKAERGYLRAAPMYNMSYLALVLSSVDAVVSPMSTLLIEALIIDKPTMAVAFGDGKHAYNPSVSAHMTHFHELKKSGILEWCDRADDFERSFLNLVGRCRRPNDPVLRRSTLDTIVSLTDSSYSRRLDEFTRTVLEPLARRRRAKRAMRERDTHSHAYHSHLILKEYCNLPWAKRVPGHWMHGWIPSAFNVHPLLVATHKRQGVHGAEYEPIIEEEREKLVQWVARPDQETYLRSEGYKHVKAIGLPFAYLPAMETDRVPGSLLVMPPHSHATHGPDDPLAEAYADVIASKRREFSEIWLCLNAHDYLCKEWVESFRKRNIPTFLGAEQGDQRTLYRLKRILSKFEYVTTNGFGSHIAYAAAAGTKLSVFGPFADCPRKEMAKAWAPRINTSLTDVLLHLHTEESVRKICPFLFVDPEKAVTCEEWGRRQIGMDVRLPPEELIDLFAWGETDSTGFVPQSSTSPVSLIGARAAE